MSEAAILIGGVVKPHLLRSYIINRFSIVAAVGGILSQPVSYLGRRTNLQREMSVLGIEDGRYSTQEILLLKIA